MALHRASLLGHSQLLVARSVFRSPVVKPAFMMPRMASSMPATAEATIAPVAVDRARSTVIAQELIRQSLAMHGRLDRFVFLHSAQSGLRWIGLSATSRWSYRFGGAAWAFTIGLQVDPLMSIMFMEPQHLWLAYMLAIPALLWPFAVLGFLSAMWLLRDIWQRGRTDEETELDEFCSSTLAVRRLSEMAKDKYALMVINASEDAETTLDAQLFPLMAEVREHPKIFAEAQTYSDLSADQLVDLVRRYRSIALDPARKWKWNGDANDPVESELKGMEDEPQIGT